MFEAKQATIQVPAKSDAPKAEADFSAEPQIVIHTLPKEFYDREIKINHPTPVPVPPPPVRKVISQPAPEPKSRGTKLWLVSGLLLLTSFLVAGSIFWIYSEGLLTPAPQVVSTPAPTPKPLVVEPKPEPAKPVSGADTDSDGLTNVEELLYGTDFRNPDSDLDTYLDGNEVFHRFDPRGLAPSTLLDTGAVRILESLELPFSMFYPTSWNPVSTPNAKRATFRSATGATVNVLWQDKATDLSLQDWYQAQVDEVEFNRLQPTITKEGYQALIGPDERVMYLETGTKVYTLMYDLGESKTIEFLQTFKMMVNSFKLTP